MGVPQTHFGGWVAAQNLSSAQQLHGFGRFKWRWTTFRWSAVKEITAFGPSWVLQVGWLWYRWTVEWSISWTCAARRLLFYTPPSVLFASTCRRRFKWHRAHSLEPEAKWFVFLRWQTIPSEPQFETISKSLTWSLTLDGVTCVNDLRVPATIAGLIQSLQALACFGGVDGDTKL